MVSRKKPYAIELKNNDSLINECFSTKWILLTNYKDFSHLRNKLIYDLANKTSNVWSPHTRYVDLYLNGEYAGLYLLTEKVEVAENKFNLNNNDILFYLELSDRAEKLSIKDFFRDSLNDSISAELAYPSNISSVDFNNAEKQIRGIFSMLKSGKISEKDLNKYIDLESFSWLYLLQEITANCDSGKISLYFYLRDGKLYAGPIWDYDNTFGVMSKIASDVLFAKNTPFWKNIVKYETFKQTVSRMYKEKFVPEFDIISKKNILKQTEIISSAINNNCVRWRIKFNNQTQSLNDFISKRIAFLNQVFIDENKYYTICCNAVTNDAQQSNEYFSVKEGATWESVLNDKIVPAYGTEFTCFDTLTEKEVKPEGVILSDTTIKIVKSNELERLQFYINILTVVVICAFAFGLILMIMIEIKHHRKRKK